jgi:hypothetical protein
MDVHVYNPSYSINGNEEDHSLRPASRERGLSKTSFQHTSQWLVTSVIPTTWKAYVGLWSEAFLDTTVSPYLKNNFKKSKRG